MLKKYIYLIITIFVVSACETIFVLNPIPNTYVFEFDINLDQGLTQFEQSDTLSGQGILEDILEQLDGDFSLDAIQSNQIEGIAITLTEADQSHAIINGNVNIEYAGSLPINLITYDNLIVGEILGEQQVLPMSEESVLLLTTAMDDIVASNTSDNIIVHTSGQVSHLISHFKIKIEITVSHLVETKVEVLDPL